MKIDKLRRAEKLIAKVNSGKFALVVEGKRDKQALRDIGVNCEIIIANGGTEQLIRRVSAFQMIPALLFDFDRTGNSRQKRLEELLLAADVVSNNRLRFAFRRVFGIKFFEEVDSAFERLKEKQNHVKKRVISYG